MEAIIQEIKAERMYQDGKWGEQNHPILDQRLLIRSPERMCEEYEIPSETRAKAMCNLTAQNGDITYMHILVEEVSEVAYYFSMVKIPCSNFYRYLQPPCSVGCAVLTWMRKT